MGTFLQDLSAQMKGIWARLEGQQRLVVVAVMFAAVIGLGGMIWYAGQPSYESVFAAKNGEEIGRVQQALGQANISFVMDDSGYVFQVERSKVGRANAAIAKEGLSGTQSISLDGGSLIEDSATKQWRLDTASRAQAQRAIEKLDGVVSVTVTASRPNRIVAYRNSDVKASATVVLRLRSGAPFEATARSAASIASSQLMVPLENIDVVSTSGGHHWSYNADRDTGAGSSEFLAMQRGISDEKTRLAQARLDQLWPGKTAVQVTVELDPSWEIRREMVLPDEPLISSEESTKDSTDTPSTVADAAAAKSKNEQKTTKYVTEIGERRVGKMAPEVRRMTVAVLYDKSLEEADFNSESLKNAVKSIVGWDADRDDEASFSMLSGTFAPQPEVEVVTTGPGISEMITRWGPTVGQALGVLVVVLFLRGLFKRSRIQAPEDEPEPDIPEEDLAPEEQQKRMRREIERSIATDPAALAKMLESWLMEQKA